MTPFLPNTRAAIDRREIVTIDRVTPGGIACVGARRFGKDRYERGVGSWRKPCLETLTPEVEADVAQKARSIKVAADVMSATTLAQKWAAQTFSYWRANAILADIERAERLAAAITQAMDGVKEK